MSEQTLLQFIVCPVCKGPLTPVKDNDREGFSCMQCDVVYPIVDDIPMLLPDSGVPRANWLEG